MVALADIIAVFDNFYFNTLLLNDAMNILNHVILRVL